MAKKQPVYGWRREAVAPEPAAKVDAGPQVDELVTAERCSAGTADPGSFDGHAFPYIDDVTGVPCIGAAPKGYTVARALEAAEVWVAQINQQLNKLQERLESILVAEPVCTSAGNVAKHDAPHPAKLSPALKRCTELELRLGSTAHRIQQLCDRVDL